MGLKKEIVKLLIPSHEQQLKSHRNNILNIWKWEVEYQSVWANKLKTEGILIIVRFLKIHISGSPAWRKKVTCSPLWVKSKGEGSRQIYRPGGLAARGRDHSQLMGSCPSTSEVRSSEGEEADTALKHKEHAV